MKIKGYIRDLHSVHQLMYKNTIEIISQFLQQQNQPIKDINIMILQQWVGSKISNINDTNRRQQNENLNITSREKKE